MTRQRYLGIGATVCGASLVVLLLFNQGLRPAFTASAGEGPNLNEVSSVEASRASFADYDAAFQAMVSCAAADGWLLVSGAPTLTRRQVYDYQFFRATGNGEASEGALRAATDTLQRCRTEHFDAIQRDWEAQMTMSASERDDARASLAACMRGRGVEAPERPSSADLEKFIRVESGVDLASRQVFRDCTTLMQSEFGLRRGELP